MDIPVKKLTRLLAPDQPAEVRAAAVLVLAELGAKDAEVSAELIARLDDESEAVRLQAIQAVGRLRVAKALPVLLNRIRSGGEEANLAADSAAKLGESGVKGLQKLMPEVAPGAAAVHRRGADRGRVGRGRGRRLGAARQGPAGGVRRRHRDHRPHPDHAGRPTGGAGRGTDRPDHGQEAPAAAVGRVAGGARPGGAQRHVRRRRPLGPGIAAAPARGPGRGAPGRRRLGASPEQGPVAEALRLRRRAGLPHRRPGADRAQPAAAGEAPGRVAGTPARPGRGRPTAGAGEGRRPGHGRGRRGSDGPTRPPRPRPARRGPQPAGQARPRPQGAGGGGPQGRQPRRDVAARPVGRAVRRHLPREAARRVLHPRLQVPGGRRPPRRPAPVPAPRGRRRRACATGCTNRAWPSARRRTTRRR